MGPDAMIFVFWMLSFKPTFSLSSFTFLKKLFSSSSLSAIRVVSSASLSLLIFLPAILIPAHASSSPAFLMMYSAYKLNKQGDNIQLWSTPFPIWNQPVVPCPILTVASWPVYRFLKRQVRWSGIPISFRIFHSLLWTCTKPIECPTPRINPNVNYRLCMIMICQCRFIRCNKCTTLVEDVGNGGYYTCLGSGDIWEICVHFSQFCYKLKSASKNIYFNSSQRRKIIQNWDLYN